MPPVAGICVFEGVDDQGCHAERFGGIQPLSMECFDATRSTWEVMPPLLQARTGMATAVVSGCLCVCGGVLSAGREAGHDPLRSAEVYDPRGTCWQPLPPMLAPRAFAAAVVIGGTRLLLCGGLGDRDMRGQPTVLSTCEYLEFTSPSVFPMVLTVVPSDAWQWRAIGSLLEPRVSMAEALVGGTDIYLCGGRDTRLQGVRSVEYARFQGLGNTPSVTETEAFEPMTWKDAPPMAKPRLSAAAAVVGRFLCVCGGTEGSESPNLVEVFDTALATWQELPPLKCPRWGPAFLGVSSDCNASDGSGGGVLYICGGLCERDILGGTSRSVECFRLSASSAVSGNADWSEASWETLPQPLLHDRVHAAGFVVDDGGEGTDVRRDHRHRYLYLFGGESTSGEALATAERLAIDPDDRSIDLGARWEALPSMPSARSDGLCLGLPARAFTT